MRCLTCKFEIAPEYFIQFFRYILFNLGNYHFIAMIIITILLEMLF